MQVKVCFKCDETKPLDEFYPHPAMADGHLNKCKDCTKANVKAHRTQNIERIREHDRQRGNRQGRDYIYEYRLKFPNKYLAHKKVGNAVRDGRLDKPANCSECSSGTVLHGHHDDYSKPLKVRWLCAPCHRQWHVENGEGANAS